METTTDGLLNNRIKLTQPANGFRVAVDTVLLAAAVPAIAGDKVLELGCGVGGAMLALACRVPGVAVTGVEVQPELLELAKANIAGNALKAELNAVQGDAMRLDAGYEGLFDHVMMNPPYHDAARHDASDDASRRTANYEEEGDLARWVESAANALKTGGALVMIHRADRLEEILDLMLMAFGSVTVKPVLPKQDALAKRILVKAIKGSKEPMVTDFPLVLHETDGRYTAVADGMLREAGALDW